MARETKVGLLVGMCVILLIGIIVSDHLSVVNQQQPAPLIGFARDVQRGVNSRNSDVGANAPADATTGVRASDRTHTLPLPEEARPNTAPPGGPSHPVPNSEEQLHNAQTNSPLIANAETPRGTTPVPPPTGASPTPPVSTPGNVVVLTRHTVKRGDTLYSLAKQYYGKTAEWKRIQDANLAMVGTQAQLKDNMTLVIPAIPGQTPAQSPAGSPGTTGTPGASGTNRTADAGNTTPSSPSRGTIRVQAGDTLANLAARHLGSRDRWLDLVEANKERLRTAKDLKPGMELRLPADSHAATPPRSEAAPRNEVTPAGPGTGTSTATAPPARPSTLVSGTSRTESPAPGTPRPTVAGPSTPGTTASTTSVIPAPRPPAASAVTSTRLPSTTNTTPATPAAPVARPGIPWPSGSGPGSTASTPAPSSVQTYTIQPEDSLQSIAQQMYGDSSQWPRIFEANRAALAGQSQLRVGQRLVIPAGSSR